MFSLRWLALVVLLFLPCGCRSDVRNASSNQKIAAHEVASFPLTVNGTKQTIWIKVKLQSDAAVNAILVLEKESDGVVDLVRKGQDVESRILMQGHVVGKSTTLLAQVPPESSVNLVLHNNSEKAASVSWEMVQ